MSDLLERGFGAMRDLRLESDAYIRQAIEDGTAEPSTDFPEPTLPFHKVITPGGLTIFKTGDFLDVSAEFEETNNGRTFEVDYEVEFPEDMRDWPEVRRTSWADPRPEVKTLPRKKFFEVAKLLSGLVVAQEVAV